MGVGSSNPAQPSTFQFQAPEKKGDWFSNLFGFSEQSYDATQLWLHVDDFTDGQAVQIQSIANNRRIFSGWFELRSLAELRARGQLVATLVGSLEICKAESPLSELQAAVENRRGTFHVPSAMNSLQSLAGQPEDGVMHYAEENTEACALAIGCGASLVFRNYFVATCKERPHLTGQTNARQINLVENVLRALGDEVVSVKGGRLVATPAQLLALNEAIKTQQDAGHFDSIMDELLVGLQSESEVTCSFNGRRTLKNENHRVSQICLPTFPPKVEKADEMEAWRPFMSKLLECAYEALLWTAVLNASIYRKTPGDGHRRVFVQIDNDRHDIYQAWCWEAFNKVVAKFHNVALKVFVAYPKDEFSKAAVFLQKSVESKSCCFQLS